MESCRRRYVLPTPPSLPTQSHTHQFKYKTKQKINHETNSPNAVDLDSYQRISNILLPPPNQSFRNIPIRFFLPLPPDSGSPSLKIVQSPVPPSLAPSSMAASQATLSRGSPAPQTQTIGSALHSLLPNLFPSRRTPVLAKPVLHGAAVPMSAPVEEVVRNCAYGDGWLYVVIRMMG